MSLYPNPAPEFVNILFENFVAIGIYDINSSLLITSTQDKIDISQLSNGVYFVTILDTTLENSVVL